MALLGLPAEERMGSMHRFELRSGRSASSPSLLHKGQAGYPRSVAVPRQPVTAFQARESVTSARMEPMVLANPVTTNDLEDRLRRRERCFGTLRASWRVKNCFSVWRSFVQMQNEAVRVQQDHEAQLRAIFDLRELLAQKEQEVRQLSLLVRTGERKRSSLERSVHVMHTGALDLVLRTRAFGAWRLLSLRDRLAGALQRVEAEAVQREADLERQLLLQLEDASSNNRRLEAELRSSERRQRVMAEEIAALQRQLDEAEAQLRKARQRHAANSDRLAMAGTEREAKAAAWALWLRALAVLRRERHEREVMEHQQALKDAAERHRFEMEEWRRDADDDRHRRESDWRSHHEKLESSWHKKLKQAEEEWERRLQQRLAEMEADFERQHALSQDQHHQAIRGNQDVFDLELARVHQAHEDQRKLREEEDRVQAEKHQLFLEELQRQQDEAKQKLLMSSLAALGGQRTQGLRSAYFLAWAQYLAHVKRDRSAEETLLSLDRKDQELRQLLAQHDALHQKLQEQEAASARQRTSHRQQALRRSDRLLGGPGLSPKEKLWISQVLGAWLLVAVAMRLARARELEASEADQLRAELQRLKVEGGKALRSQARETLETRRRQALLLQILRSWMRVVWQQHLQAHRSETDEMSKLLRSRKDLLLHRTCEAFGRKLRRHLLWTMFQSWRSRVDVSADALGSRQSYEVKMDRLGRQLLLRASSVLLTSSFTAWSRTARLLRFDRAAQQMLSKVDFLQRWGQSRRDHLLDKSEDLGRLCLARVALAVWSQAFWILGLLNNFLWVVLNAGANEINSAGVALVYLVNVLPSLMMKLSGPYWFHYVSYKYRIWIIALLMVLCLLQVAWGQGPYQKLLGVAMASLAAGIGEASLLAMSSFYEAKPCLTAWSSGTGFAGIAGYVWSLLFDYLDACFQVELMVALWLPVAFLLAFHCILGPPWIDEERGIANVNLSVPDCTVDSPSSNSEELESEESTVTEHHASELATAKLSVKERFSYILSLWPYTVPLFLVYAAEYTIQAGFWAAMGFPVTDPTSRHKFYKWANFMYQIGVFISRSTFILICRNRKVLWSGGFLQVVMALFFAAAAWQPFGDWWLLAPAFFVGCLGGGVYVGAFTLIAQEQPPSFVELALSAASVADTFGMIAADIMGLLIQGCVFGHLQVLDEAPDFKCGFDIWDSLNKTVSAKTYEARGAQLEKQRRTWSSELRRRADRGSNCGSRLAGKFWTLKMRLLVFATFMTWRLRLVNESSAKLRRTMADREAAEHAGASRSLLLTDAFRRWRRFANARAAERAAQLSAPAPGAPGRVVSVVSAIEERRTRVLALEAFHRYALDIQNPTSVHVIHGMERLTWCTRRRRVTGVLGTASFGFGNLQGRHVPCCFKARLLARRTGPTDLPGEEWWPDLGRCHLTAQLRMHPEDGRFLSLDRLWAAIRARPEAVNTATPEGKPLTIAVKKGCRGAAELLRNSGGVLTCAGADQLLRDSAARGNVEALRLLLFEASGRLRSEPWASPNARPVKHGGTPLDMAVSRNQQECVELLLKAGGRHSLHRAAELAMPAMVRAWLDEGAAVEECDSSGATPLLLAAKGTGRVAERTECLELLLRADAMVDALPITQETPLMHAAARGVYEHCKLLLEARADCHRRDRRDRQPIDHAATKEVRALLSSAMSSCRGESQSEEWWEPPTSTPATSATPGPFGPFGPSDTDSFPDPCANWCQVSHVPRSARAASEASSFCCIASSVSNHMFARIQV
ncbi:BTN1 [Symbiodinium natans]|uniref:BTN1 protein n=1 Tax=Symbiodinium natans TaxID=878477 RepID=A0A812T9J7_9DINO|nr:BTN1 [Symbiodinium natans]